MADVRRIEHNRGVEHDARRDGRAVRIERERRLARLARRQSRAVGRDQMLRLGFTRSAISHRLRTNRLYEIHPGVYVAGPGPLDQRGRWFAALLASRPRPVLSHLSSAAKRGLARERGLVHVTTVSGSARKLRGVTVHRARRLHPADVTRVDGLPVTTLPRTLLDLAETEPYHRLESIAEAADRREPLDLRAIRACMERNPGRRGLGPLTLLLDDYLPVGDANEGLERLFQRFLAKAGFPQPQTNVLVFGLLVDCHWPDHDFVVELDSVEHHSHRAALERDTARDGKLLRAGIPCLRVTHRRITRERGELIADLASRLPRN